MVASSMGRAAWVVGGGYNKQKTNVSRSRDFGVRNQKK